MAGLAAVACASPVHPPSGPVALAPDCVTLPIRVDAGLKADLDRAVDAAVAEGFAGQVAVLEGSALVYRRSAGFADRRGAIPVTADTKFHVASIAKHFTAALALRAAEEGELHLDAAISPLIEGTDLARRGVTFADLLAHRSGLGSSYAAERKRDPEAAVLAIDAAGVDESEIGEFHYSNDGYDLLAILLERIYGQSYEALVREKLLAQACLGHTAFWGETDLTDPLQVAQALRSPGLSLRRRNYGMLGSAGLLTTADDLVAWQYALKSSRVLSPDSYRELMAPRGAMRLGRATFGGFILNHQTLGEVFSLRGYEDWGDNAYMNDYTDCGVMIAVVTSRGPDERSGQPPFRDKIMDAFERSLARRCEGRRGG